MPSTIKNRIIFDADIGDTEANEDNSNTISSRGASIFPKKSKSTETLCPSCKARAVPPTSLDSLNISKD